MAARLCAKRHATSSLRRNPFIVLRRTKIVATLGPASRDPKVLGRMIQAGLDVVRVNFSHGSAAEHRRLVGLVRTLARKAGRAVGVLVDLQGPKIRCLKMEGGAVELKEGSETVITIDDILGTAERFGTLYKSLPKDVKQGELILLDDGNMTLEVLDKTDRDVRCKVIFGGILKDKKGINLPNSNVSAPSLSEKDIRDAHFGAEVLPAGKAVLARDHELRNPLRQRRLEPRQMRARTRERVRVALGGVARELLGLLTERVERRAGGKRLGRGHGNLLS